MTIQSVKVTSAIIMMLLLITMAACSKNTNESVQQPASHAPATEKQSDDDKIKEAEATAETREVTDEFGSVTIPAKPQRVAAIYLEDYLKALDVTPVVQWYHPTWGTQEYLQLDAPLFDITGSLEALLAYSPDLIIVDGVVDKANYEQYSLIAPTYRIPENKLQSAEDIFKTVADVLSIPEKAEAVLKQYADKVSEAKAMFDKTVGRETFAVIRVNTGDNTIALFGVKNRYAGEIYSTFGLEPHPLAKNMESFQEILSEEAFAKLDADHIIVFPSNGSWESPENQEAFELLNSPLWNSVPAFKNNKVYKFERSHWQSGAITANMKKLDDIVDVLSKK